MEKEHKAFLEDMARECDLRGEDVEAYVEKVGNSERITIKSGKIVPTGNDRLSPTTLHIK